MIQTKRLAARALEPVAQCLIRHLHVPQIYFNAPWPCLSHRADLLVVDRAGTGDLHVVEMEPDASSALKTIPHLLALPAHYRWLAFFHDTLRKSDERALAQRRILYPLEEAGRIGVIEIVRKNKDDLEANIVVKAERFHGLEKSVVAAFVAKHEPDISFD